MLSGHLSLKLSPKERIAVFLKRLEKTAFYFKSQIHCFYMFLLPGLFQKQKSVPLCVCGFVWLSTSFDRKKQTFAGAAVGDEQKKGTKGKLEQGGRARKGEEEGWMDEEIKS